jgi:hypothetical protein
MRKLFLMILSVIISTPLFSLTVQAGWGTAPANWGDVRIGLVNDNSAIFNKRMKQAVAEGAKLSYRYRYINGGFDSTKNAMSWMFTQYTDYVAQSDLLAGVKPAFVIYMLQEEGGSAATIANVKDAAKMKQYFANIRSIALRSKGCKSVFVIEPDTWGYLLQNGYTDPSAIPAVMSTVARDFTWLAGLPDNLCGIAQGVIRTIHTFAPDAYAGCLASHWAYIGVGWHVDGMVWSQDTLIHESVRRNVAWFSKLLGTGADRGDFIGVEKNGYSAGRWKVMSGTSRWYWGDAQMVKYIAWCKGLGQGLGLPVVGWQISIGHMGLPNVSVTTADNSNNSYEDTFFPYFFTHVNDFVSAGFIGFLVGKGLADDTDFSNETEGAVADRGWFFTNLKAFDRNRPYLSTSAHAPRRSAASAAGAGIRFSSNTLTIFGGAQSIDIFDLRGSYLKTLHFGKETTIFLGKGVLGAGAYVARFTAHGSVSVTKRLEVVR